VRWEDIVSYGLEKPGVREDYPFGPSPLVLKVGSKMFALVSRDGDGSVSVSLKCDPDAAVMLRQEFEAVKPGYHLNKTHWNTVVVDGSVPERDLRWMIDHSYELVRGKLPKAERESLKRT